MGKDCIMRKIAKERGIRLSHRFAKLCDYLRDEAGEKYAAEQLMKYGGTIGACMIQLEMTAGTNDYMKGLHEAVYHTVKARNWLNLMYDKGYIEDRTYVSMNRECLDLMEILLRKTENLFADLDL